MTPLLYLVAISVVIFSTLSVSAYCIIKIFQVSNGFSLLDPDASLGLRIRKWFLLCVSISNASRCIASLIEFMIFSIRVVKDDVPVETISFYSGIQSILPYTVFACRNLPGITYLLYNALISLYVSFVYHTIWGFNFSTVKICWISGNAVFFMILLQYILIYPNPKIVSCLFIALSVIYILYTMRYTVSIYKFYSDVSNNMDRVSRSSAVSIGNNNASNINGNLAGAASKRIVARLFYLNVVLISSLTVNCGLNLYHLSRTQEERSFYYWSSIDFLGILYCEALSAFLAVSLISDYFKATENSWVSNSITTTESGNNSGFINTTATSSSAYNTTSYDSGILMAAARQEHPTSNKLYYYQSVESIDNHL